MKTIVALILSLLLIACSSTTNISKSSSDEKWSAIHLLGYENDKDLEQLAENIGYLKELGINTLIVEVDYSFDFKSHPELKLSNNVITREGAQKFSKICKENNMRLITEFQCFGHQSWDSVIYPLLTKYPHLDSTPGAFPKNKGIYCREWDITNPEVYKIVYALIDEIIDAFDVDGFHVGMDEIFLLQSEFAKNTNQKNPAEMYAKAVNDMYSHIVTKRGIPMLMWGDRLIDNNLINYGEWEASANGTAPAIDMIPKDIIICDWHYEDMIEFPSVPMFLEKGFRVLPTSWREIKHGLAFIDYSFKFDSPKMLGHLFSTWGKVDLRKFEMLSKGTERIKTITNKKVN